MRKTSLTALTTSVCSLALILSGCGSSNNANNDNNPQAGSTTDAIISVFGSEPAKPLIPSNTNEVGGGNPLDMLFSKLVRFDDKGKPVNDIAKEIKPNADMTKYTITIKDGWKFTDGTPVTASSFTKAWSWGANAANGQLSSSFFNPIKGFDDLQASGVDPSAQLSGLKVLDDHTFTVELNAPSSTFPILVGYTSYAPLPEVFYKDTKAFGEKPVSVGPYKFKSWEHNKSIVLVKNPDYQGDIKVKNGGLEFRNYTDPTAAYADVQSGNLDVMDTIPTSALKTYMSDQSVQAKSEPGSVFQYITIPSAMNHFKEDEEGRLRRQAISMSIDRQKIIDKVLAGTAKPATDFIAPPIPGYSASLKGGDVLKYNPKKAKELWTKANAISPWAPNDSFKMAYNSDGGHKDIYDAIANSIKNSLGIDAAGSPIPTFSEFNGNITRRTFAANGMAFRTGWQPDYPSPEDYLKPKFASSSAGGHGSNHGDYKNRQVDDLLNQAAAAKSTDAANKVFQQAEEILLKDLPTIPLYYANSKGVAAKGIHGFAFTWKGTPVYPDLTK
ncbi:peptide ABC transporter substrate-binding protein [Bifidobacterium actinocoloniiforme]|nr:ABC transporter substrate-binding protein [Bifidobacterium actinocoloniiforme]AKV56092.1 ABC transporter substrate-binding protein [Bifidobacterium actinocoloniiforme DSM 22766]